MQNIYQLCERMPGISIWRDHQAAKHKQNAHNSKQIGSGRGVLSLFSFMHNTYGILYTFLLLPFFVLYCCRSMSVNFKRALPLENAPRTIAGSTIRTIRIQNTPAHAALPYGHFMMMMMWCDDGGGSGDDGCDIP